MREALMIREVRKRIPITFVAACRARAASGLSRSRAAERSDELAAFHLFDDLVGEDEQCWWHGQAKRLSGLEIDHPTKFGRLLYG
jgi:hypothetical protein